MPFDFCIPTRATSVPNGPDWLHEIKYDGYRLRLERNGDRVRLITKGGYDWTKRFPWIAEAALKNRQKHFVIDGEAVIPGVDGYSDFNALHSGKHNDEVQLLAFDVMAMDGDSARSAVINAQGQPCPTTCAPAGRHFPERFRTGRDRARFVSGGLQYGTRGLGIEATGSSLPRRSFTVLGKGQEPHTSCDGSGRGVIEMTTLAKLLAQKQELIARLQQEDIGPEERDEIERLLEKIEAALDLLDKAGPNGPQTGTSSACCKEAGPTKR
jgi:ATP dependent DNA ligase domain